MDKIYDEYYYKIYNWSLKKTNNKEDAEDLTNSIFLAIFEYLNKNIKVEKIENLIWKIAYNIWCTRAKKYIKEKEIVSFDEQFQASYNENMIDKIIYKEITTNLESLGITKKEKIVFNMYYLEDLSIKDISKKTNFKEANIKYYLYSVRNKIKERYYE